MAARVALLMGHLGGRAYSLRSGIVTALGHLVVKAFENVPGEDADAQGARPAQAPPLTLMRLFWRSYSLPFGVFSCLCS